MYKTTTLSIILQYFIRSKRLVNPVPKWLNKFVFSKTHNLSNNSGVLDRSFKVCAGGGAHPSYSVQKYNYDLSQSLNFTIIVILEDMNRTIACHLTIPSKRTQALMSDSHQSRRNLSMWCGLKWGVLVVKQLISKGLLEIYGRHAYVI